MACRFTYEQLPSRSQCDAADMTCELLPCDPAGCFEDDPWSLLALVEAVACRAKNRALEEKSSVFVSSAEGPNRRVKVLRQGAPPAESCVIEFP